MKPLLIVHRGDTNNFPENTIEAFSSAFEKGADGIELDVQFHQGNLIVVHDYLFDQTKKYPLLSKILELFSKKGRIEMEIKSMDLDFLPSLKLLLSKYENSDFEITTSIFPLVNYLRKEFPTISLGVIFLEKEFEAWMTNEFICLKVIKMMKLLKVNDTHMPWKVINQNIVNSCHKQRIQLHSHIYKQSLNAQLEIYKKMKEFGVDQSTFDDISLLNEVRKIEENVTT